MDIPSGVKSYNLKSHTLWFDADGVLYSKSKPEAKQAKNRTELEHDFAQFKEITGGKKVCLIVESDNSSRPPKKEDRDYIAQELGRSSKLWQ